MGASEDLETHFHIFLLVLYVIIPVTLITLKCSIFNNIPLKDILYFNTALSSYSLIIMFIVLFGTDRYCTLECEDDCSSDYSCSPWGGLENTYINVGALIIVPLVSFGITFILEPIHAYRCGLGMSENHAVLPIEFTATPVETMRDMINRIVATGPTVTAGVMFETAYTTFRGNRTSIWGLLGWEQFTYKTWSMTGSPPPYFHKDQDCFFKFKDLEEVFSYQGPLIIKTSLEVLPANDQTKMKHENWISSTQAQIRENEKGYLGENTLSKDFTEEMVTDEALWDDHSPNRLVPSIQLPSLVTNKVAFDTMVEESSRFVYGNMMEAKERLICDQNPFWLTENVYGIFGYMFLSSLYRIFYWTKVKVVRLHFKKTFNTEPDMEEPDSFPYKNNIQNFVLKPPA